MYIGCTDDINKRIREHNKGINFATKGRAPLKLIYFEGYRHRKDAESRERFFKTGWGRQHIKDKLKHFFNSAKT